MPNAARRQIRRPWLVWPLLLAFVFVGVAWFWSADGQDLGSSYVGCRLLADGHSEALYNYDPDNFAGIGPGDLWQTYAIQGGFHGYIHPYVQTPLWAYGLEPICTRTHWLSFERVFLCLTMLCMAASVWLVARYWTPTLYTPLAMALILVGLWFSQPFQYAMFLMQTHALFFFLSVASLILAEKNRPVAAGLLLACAAAVKITPGFLLIYWLLTRRWKAAVSMVVWSAALLLITRLALGSHLTSVYFADLQRISRVLLVAQNNQSFAAWCMARFYPPDAVFDIDILPLPSAVRIGSTLLMVTWTAIGGFLDRGRGSRSDASGVPEPPVGAMIALVAAVIFAPIAWTHYSIILVAPLMVLAQESRALRSWWVAGLAIVVLLLNFRPLATDVIDMDIGTLAIVRGQFYAGVLAIVALATAGWLRRSRPLQTPA